VSRLSPKAEKVLMEAMKQLLEPHDLGRSAATLID